MNLQTFLYLLMRDETTPGAVARIVNEIEDMNGSEFLFCNKHLAAMAKEYADRLSENTAKSN